MVLDTEADNVRVVVRCRPLSEMERSQGNKSVVHVDVDTNSVSVTNPFSPQVSL